MAEADRTNTTSADRKPTASGTAMVTTGAATLAASILWAMGCWKGGQFYTPDDALVLAWAGWLFPIVHALYNKLGRWVGVEQAVVVFVMFAGLSACASTEVKPTPAEITSKSVEIGCKALPLLDLTFRSFAPLLKVTQEQINWEVGVVKTASAACAARNSGTEAVISAAVMSISDFLTANGAHAAGP